MHRLRKRNEVCERLIIRHSCSIIFDERKIRKANRNRGGTHDSYRRYKFRRVTRVIVLDSRDESAGGGEGGVKACKKGRLTFCPVLLCPSRALCRDTAPPPLPPPFGPLGFPPPTQAPQRSILLLEPSVRLLGWKVKS